MTPSAVVPTRETIGNRRHFGPLAGGGYVLELIDDGVRVEVRNLRTEWRQLHGEVELICSWAGAPSRRLCADLNLSSQREREARAKSWEKQTGTRPGDFDWFDVADDVSVRAIEAERTGTEAIVLDDAPAEGPPRDFLVHGLAIPADSHSQLVTDGGGLKSLLILLVLGEMAQRGIPVALLDWEWNAARHLARKRRLFGDARLESLFYLRCRNSLIVEHDHIRRFCEQRGIQFVGLDSIGAACDGKLADDDVARAYNRALSDLPPSLAAAHIPKSEKEPNIDLKAFGSAFFHNFARMTWSVKKQIGASDDIVTVMLTPFKQNDGARLRPVGLEFTFAADRIDVRGVDPTQVEGFSQSMPLGLRMTQLLKTGPLTIAAIASQLDAKPDSISKTVQRSRDAFTKVLSQDGVTRIALVERRLA